ncbi:signal peptidase I [Marinagarivorans algicola]|uniref:signal peptidase I n=1 Tax=Marinagarivorans algicola TaxID=1513270 RepID=UPI0006B62B3A|nr:signal peptidase I [Marinagarivorans algicola]
MDIDLPLILMIAVALTGVVWLLDIVVFSRKRREESAEPAIVEYSKSFFPVLFLVFFLRSFLVEPFQIPSGSMIPTLQVGDYIAVNKFAYGVRMPVFRTKLFNVSEPERGDAVVFFPPNEERYFIKRLVGLPGDKIQIINHELVINGEKQIYTELTAEELAKVPGSETEQLCSYHGDTYQVVKETLGEATHLIQKCTLPTRVSASGSWTVPAGHYFMMGDNRDNSTDSRVWGMVPEANLVGKAFAVWMHWPELASLPSFSRSGAIE